MKAYSLICHRDVDQAIRCLGSFLHMAKESIDLHLYDDGSLEEEDEQRLCKSLSISPSRILHAEEPHSSLLGYPHLLSARKKYVMCLKLLDIPLLNEEAKLIIDTDILFLRPFGGLQRILERHDFVCMRDLQSSYSTSITSRFALRLRGNALISHANAGFLLVHPQCLNLELLEDFFSKQAHHRFPALIEQTAWAMLGAKSENPAYWTPEAVTFPPKSFEINDSTIAWHFASDFRYLLSQFPNSPHLNYENDINLTTIPVQLMGISEEATRIWKNFAWSTRSR